MEADPLSPISLDSWNGVLGTVWGWICFGMDDARGSLRENQPKQVDLQTLAKCLED